ncbi:hypothetical protein PCC79_13230 [Propioniciclava soli]|uniref:Cytochrome P450 n=1 Tax=Propioniciclava soli TaxID=2775081 RepID=A0ABZ3C7Z2_9ACTN
MSNSTEVPLRNRAALVGRLALARGYTAWHAWGRRDPLMALFTPAGRRQRYRLYERLRAEGPVVRSSAGMASVVSHPLADGLLRSRDVSVRVGQQNPAEQILDLSLLELDPPDHTRLRALVAPRSPRGGCASRRIGSVPPWTPSPTTWPASWPRARST